MWAPDVQAGVQLAAVKFLQRVILVQSRGVADPRVSEILFCLHLRCRPKMSLLSLPPQSYKTKMTQTFRLFPETTHLSMRLLSKPKALLSYSV
jgi:Symplekin/PTA1 N-terminal